MMANQKKPLGTRTQTPGRSESPASSALARAAALHLEEKPGEALAVLDAVEASGDSEAESHSARGFLHYELGQVA